MLRLVLIAIALSLAAIASPAWGQDLQKDPDFEAYKRGGWQFFGNFATRVRGSF